MKFNTSPKQYTFNRFCNWILDLKLNPEQYIHACNLSKDFDFIYKLRGKRQEGRSTIGLSYAFYKAYIKSNTRVGVICRDRVLATHLAQNNLIMDKIRPFAKNFNRERYDFINGSSIHFCINVDDLRRKGAAFDYVIIDDIIDNLELCNLIRFTSFWCKQLVAIIMPSAY